MSSKYTYNPTSGAIKRDGVVVGTITYDKRKKKYSVKLYNFAGKKIAPTETIEELLPQVKEALNAI